MARVYNFSAGPSMLPEKVLKQAQAELLEYGGSGQSVMEMSHRSKWFDEIIQNTEAGIRKVLNVLVLIKVRASNVRHNIAVGIAVSITVSQT